MRNGTRATISSSFRFHDSRFMVEMDLIIRLHEFLEQEARSCSMDFACVTPLYAYRMFGGQYSIQDIEYGLQQIKEQGTFGL